MNPFERKFREFAQTLTTKNAQGHADQVASISGDVFKDKPFTEEFKTVYAVAQWGQSVAQVVTFLTTAALGVFALTHIIPLWWGIYVAVPLGLLFAFGVEKVKRSTLAIASKHLLKYKTFGFVGFVALLTLCVSIAAALYGAKELPGVVYPLPARMVDGSNVQTLSADIERVQADIDRTAADLKSGKNWIAENHTLPRLQKERAALIEKRDAATREATGRGDMEHAEALAARQEKVDKMQGYAVGAAIVAELVFLLCTGFVFYYLFRHFAEVNHEAPGETDETLHSQPTTPRPTANGRPTIAQNLRSAPEVVAYTLPAVPTRARNAAVTNATVTADPFNKSCAQCSAPFYAKVGWQKFCSEPCKLAFHEAKHGTRFDPGKRHKKKAAA